MAIEYSETEMQQLLELAETMANSIQSSTSRTQCDQSSIQYVEVDEIASDAEQEKSEKPTFPRQTKVNSDQDQLRSIQLKTDDVENIPSDAEILRAEALPPYFTKVDMSKRVRLNRLQKGIDKNIGKRCARYDQGGHLSQHETGDTPKLRKVEQIGENPHKCRICDKSFSLKGSLTRHLLIHSGDKRHTCRICKKSFSRKHDLSRHLLIHSDEKPLLCDICDKTFRKKGDLVKHMKIHQNIRRKSQLPSHSRVYMKE